MNYALTWWHYYYAAFGRIGQNRGKILSVLLVYLAAAPVLDAATLVQDFYLPMPEQQIYQANNAIITGTSASINSTFSIVVTGSGTVVYYDQWEDGYEIDLGNPAQSTSKVWGDGNNANGVPPGFTNDPIGLAAGTVITLTNVVALPRNPSTFLWDARDRVAANKALVISRAGWPTTTGPVFAGAVGVLSTMDYGTNYISPVGQDITNNLFKYVGMFIMAAQNNTAVRIDPNGNGVGITNIVLNQGESYLVNGGIKKGGRATATKPIQADLVIGHVGAQYASDWFTLYPVEQWDNTYYTPVSSAATQSQPAYVYLYNPNATAITINYATQSGSGSFSVAATNVFRFQTPVGSGASFVSAGAQNFFAICTVAANNSSDTAYNWGFTLVPKAALTTEADVGWGPGSADGTVNGSPVWVTTLANTRIYVDYKGDRLGALIDANGNHYDTNFDLVTLQSKKIYDPNKNQTGMRVYTLDGTLLTAAWGEDADVAAAGNPYIDAGTTVLPFPTPFLIKTAVIVTDSVPVGLSVGDTIAYSVQIDNKGLLPLGNTVVIDLPSTNLLYLTNTTTWNGAAIPDSVSGTPFPLDTPGFTIPIILARGTSTFTYLEKVTAGGIVSNSVNIGGTTIFSSASIAPAGSATVSLNFTDTNGVGVSLYPAGGSVFITMTNAVGNTASNTIQSIVVTVLDTNLGDAETILLVETSTNSGIFRNAGGLPTSTTTGLTAQDGILNVAPGDTLSVSYTDPIFGDSASATALIQVPALQKQLYLTFTNSAQGLTRYNPTALGRGPTRSSIDLGGGTVGTIGLDGAASFGTNSASTTVTVAYTTGSGGNRFMLVSVGVDQIRTVSGVTYNGTAMTLITNMADNANTKPGIALFSLTNPAAGNHNVVVTFATGGNDIIGINTFSNVNQASPLGTAAASASSGTATVSSAAGQLVYATVCADTAQTDAVGQTQQWARASGTTIFGVGSTKTGAASVTMTWTPAGGSVKTAVIAVPIQPALLVAGTLATSFLQTPIFQLPFTMPSNNTVLITNFITVTNGTMPVNPAVTATLQYNGTNILTLTNPVFTAAVAGTNLVWSGTLPASVTVPAGQALSYLVTNNQSGVTFHLDYDSTNRPSQIVLPASTVVHVDSLAVYDAPYPGGSLVVTPVAGSSLYVRANVSDPFGSYDVNGLGLAITGPTPGSSVSTNLNDTKVVSSDSSSKVYEFAWQTGATTGSYNLVATASEGTEGVTHSAAASVSLIFLDLGAPSTTEFINGSGVATNAFPAATNGSACLRVTDTDQNLNSAAIESVAVTVTSSSGDSENVTLFETGTNSGVFTSCLTISTNSGTGANNGTLLAPAGSILTVGYVDPTDSSDTSSATATVLPPPGIPGVTITKTIVSPSGGRVAQGDPITFNLQVINTGSTTLSNVTVSDSFPAARLTYSSASLAPNTVAAGFLAWTNLGAMTPGQLTNFTVTFAAASAGAVTNSATANGSTAIGSSSVTFLITHSALSISKVLLTPTNQPVAISSNAVFRITVQNTGNTTITNLPLEDNYSGAYFQFVSATIPPNGTGAGSLLWTNLTPGVPLATNGIITIDVTMKVIGAGNPANNTAAANFAVDSFGDPIPSTSGGTNIVTVAAGISGYVYNDADLSGTVTTNDTPLSGVTVQVYTDPTGTGTPGTLVQLTTTVGGYYELLNLEPGKYVVVATPLPGYANNVPATGRLAFNLTSLTTTTNNNFLQYQPSAVLYSTFNGAVFDDVAGTGTNTTQAGLAVVSVDLVSDINSNGVVDTGEPVLSSATTDVGGNYSFAGVTPGRYVIHETDLYGYYSSGDSQPPNDNQISFTTTNGVTSTNNNFFDRLAPTAVADTNSGFYYVPVVINPLTNDLSPNGDLLTISNIVTSGGIVVINPGGTNFTFTPTNSGVIVINYTNADQHGGSSGSVVTLGVTAQADLGIGKTAAASVFAASNLVYTISVTNFGPSGATGVIVTDALPANVSFVSASAGGTANGSVVTWSLGLLAAGATTNLSLTVTAPASGAITNIATVGSPIPDPTPGNGTNPPVTTSVTPVANLAIAKSAAGSVFAASNLTYTISVTNFGPSDAVSVTVTDALPVGVTFVSASGNGANNSGIVTWSLGTLIANATTNLTLTVTAPASGSITNVATVGSPTSDPNPTNSSPPVTTTVTPVADLAIGKNAAATVFAASNLVYTISVTNFGPSDASSVTVTDALPAGVTFVGASGNGANNSGIVTWSLGTLAANATTNLTLTVTAPASGSITNIATVGSPTGDPNPTNSSPPVTTTVTPVADLAITKSAEATVFAASNLTYTISVTNFGPSAASSVTVTDALPVGVTFVSASGNGANNSGIVTWSLGTLIANATTNLTVTVTAPAGGSITNIATVGSPTGDPNPTNSSPPVPTSVTPVADLAITKSAAATVFAASNLTYTISVTNFGPSDASSVTVTDALPVGVTFVNASNGGVNNSGIVTWSLGTLAANAATNLTLTVTAPASGSITNVATVGSPTSDPNPTNSSPPVTTSVIPVADLAIGKNAAATVFAASNLVYTISVTNFGPSDASSVTVTDALPAGVTFVSAFGNGANNSGIVTWSLGTLAANATTNLTLTVTAPTSGSITNIATVDSPTGDPNPTNSSPPVTTSVTPVADVAIGKNAAATVFAASNLVYTISVTNFGPSDASSVTVTDALPVGVAFVSASGNGANNSGIVTWSLGTLAANAATNLTLTVTAPASGSITNVAAVDSPTGDPNPTNSSPPVTTTVTPVADLVIAKSAAATVFAASNLVYTISVTNFGPSDASGVIVTDALPAGVTFVNASSGGIDNSGIVTWSLGTLAANAVTNLTLTVTAPASGSITNIATVGSPTGDPNPTNSSPPVPTSVTPVADLVIGKNAAATVFAASNLTYTITVTNFGPSDASSVTVTDALPVGVVFVSASGNGANNSGIVTWSLGTLAANAVTNLTLTVTAPASGSITNVAAAGSPTGDPDPTNSTSPPVETTVISVADLAIAKSAASTVFAASNLVYTISVTNFGPSAASSVTVTDALPVGVTFVSASGNGVDNSGIVTWDLGTLTANTTTNLTLTVTAPASGSITNIATVGSPTGDPNPTNSSPPVPTSITPVADLAIGKNAAATVFAASNLTYTISVTNFGPSDASSVTVTDALPVGVTFVSASGNGANNSGIVTWDLGTLTANAMTNLTVTVTAPASGSITNVATVGSPTDDPNPTNSSPPVTTTVTPVADLVITKNAAATVFAASNLTYTITVTNFGPSDASSVTVTDALPVGVTFVGASDNGVNNSGIVTWDLGTMVANAVTNLTLTVTAPTSGSITNVATVGSPTGDPNPTNSSPPVMTSVIPVADLVVGKSGPAGVTFHTGFSYVITVTNLGPSASGGISVTDALPNGLVFVGSSPVTTTNTANQVIWNLAGLAAGETTNLTLDVTSTLIVTATNIAFAGSPTSDPIPGNNGSTPVITDITNAPPIANPDSSSTTENTAITVSPLDNDILQTPGGSLTIVAVSPTNGTASILGDTNVLFTPTTDFIGTATVGYTIIDNVGGTNTSLITITVTNIPPIANPDSASTAENTSTTVSPLVNDSVSTPGGSLTIIAVSPTNGTASILGGTTVLFTPATNFIGTATIDYTITDGIGGTNSSTITITVTNIPPVANPDNTSTTENTSTTVSPLVNDSVQTPGGSLTIIDVSPINGTASILGGTNVLFTPDTNFVGTATVGYTITDGIGGTNSSIITITVTNIAPIANPDSASTTENTAITVSPLVNDSVSTPGGSLTIIDVSPTNGLATIIGGTNVLFTPATNFLGTATIGYTITDGIGGTNSSTITITVTNIAPIANPDNASDTENTPITVSPLDNDGVSTPGGNLTIIDVSPTNGTASIIGGTNVLFTPDTNFVGTATIGYTITDGIGGTNSSLITITVTNIPPVANPDTASTTENTAITVSPLDNDTVQTPGGSLTIIAVSPTNGTASILGGTNVLFTPTTDFIGTATIGYTIIDNIGGTNSSLITITVTNIPPVANPDSGSTTENTAITVSPLVNDTVQTPGGSLVIIDVNPSSGTATILGSTVQFVPATNFVGTATIDYTITDGIGGTNSSVITITVTNIAPIANPDSASVIENTPVTVSPLVNDAVQTPGGTLSVIAVSPTNGTASIIGGTNVLFAPDTNFVGTATIGYTISDGIGGTNRSLITITVTNIPPLANPDTFAVAENSITNVLTPTDNDLAQTPGGELIVTSVSPTNSVAIIAADGTNVLFTPATNFVGTATVGYTVSDGIGGFTDSLITVLVTNIPPIANADNVSTTENTAITVSPLDNDTVQTPGGSLTIIDVSPTNGTASIIGGTNVLFTPATSFLGTATVGYTISDGIGGTNSSLITITVTNIPPIANPDSASTTENTAITVSPLDNDTVQTPGGSLTIIAVSPTNGTASILGGTNVLFTPTTDFIGTATIGYTIIDNIGGTNSSLITVTITNIAPIANPDAASDTENTPITVSPLVNDSVSTPGGNLTIINVSPTNGTASIVGSTVQFVPATNFLGTATIGYTITDGIGGTNSSLITITVTNIAPIANPDSASTTENTSITVSPLVNDSVQTPGGTLGIIAVSPTNGTASIIGGTNVLFAPDTNFVGIATVGYTITDGIGGTATSLITITVTNIAPLANPDTFAVAENSVTNVLTPTDNDLAQTPGGELIVISVSPTNSVAAIAADGTNVLFTPATNFVGTATVGYTIIDSIGGFADSLITVLVTNIPPIANPDNVSGTENTALTVSPLDNDTIQTPGGSLAIISVNPTNGTASIVGGTNVLFNPTTNFLGTATIGYTIIDGIGGTNSSLITITVTNIPPVANPDSANDAENTSILLAPLVNDTVQTPGGSLTIVAVSPTNGTASILGGTTVLFTPATNFLGTATIGYTITDGIGGTNSSIITVTVTNVAPAANPDSASMTENTAITVTPLVNDSVSTPGGSLTIINVNPTNGTASILGGTNVLFTPSTNFVGTATIGYTISDGIGGTNGSLITITVTNIPPVANPDSASITENTPITVSPLVNDTVQTPGGSLTIIDVSPTNGTASIIGGTGVQFTPAANFLGTATIGYTIIDGIGGTNSSLITITVTNIPPVANPDSAATAENVAVTVSPLVNDSVSTPGGSLTVIAVSPTNGTASIIGGTDVLFTPATNFVGTATIGYTITDGIGGTNRSLITIAVTNNAPIANPDSASITENTAITVSPLDNDILQTPGGSLAIIGVDPTNGTASIIGGTNVLFTPATNFLGTATVGYTITDGVGGTNSSLITITVTNIPPVANPDSVSDTENTSIIVSPLVNDSVSTPGGSLTIIGVVPANGTASIIGGTNVLFTPATNFLGAATVNYTITDGIGGTNSSLITITVTNIPPIANPDVASDTENTPITVSPLVNDSVQTPGGSLTIIGVSPTNGTASIIGGTTVLFTPATNFLGTATVGYTITDGIGGTNSSLITITVTNIPPVANPDTYAVAENSVTNLLAPTANDLAQTPGGDIVVTSVSPTNSVAVIAADGTNVLFTPATNFIGTATVGYTIIDSIGGSTDSLITVLVTNIPPVASPDSASDTENTPITLSPLINDTVQTPGGSLTIIGVTPTNGTASIIGGTNVLFTPATNFLGTATIGYTISDGIGGTNGSVITVTITNIAPIANPDAASDTENTPITVSPLVNDSVSTPGGNLTIINVSPTNGTATIIGGTNVLFTPATNFLGTATVGYTISDGIGGTNGSLITITVTNIPPVANPDSASGTENTPITVSPLINDSVSTPGGSLTIIGVSPTNGTASIVGSTVQFVPATNFLGTATIGYTIKDGIGGTNSSLITITVTNIPPVANPDSASTAENTSTTISPLVNDSVSTPGGSLTIVAVSPTNGTASILGGTTVLFTPATNFLGTATIGYTISDGIGGTNSSIITVTVTNVAPAANPDSASITENTSTTVSPLVNDSVSTPGGSLTIVNVNPTNGTASILGGTNVLFTPSTNFVGTATIGYTITDGIGGTNGSLITITVTNIPPVANPDSGSTTENTSTTVSPLVNDTIQTPGGSLTIIGLSPTNGTASIIGGTNVLFTPATNFLGTATIGYTIKDGIGGTNSSLITITITNIAPIANPDAASDTENTPITVSPLVNDSVSTPGGNLTIITVSPTNGTASIIGGTNVLFTPATNFLGTATIGYTIKDGIGGTNGSLITITVTNIAPIANPDSAAGTENTSVTVKPLANDSISTPGGSLTIIAVSPTNGTASIIGGTNVLFTPATNFLGTATIGYTITDGIGGTNGSLITITVTNIPPVANPDSASVTENTLVVVSPLVNDTVQTPGGSLTLIAVSPTNGTASIVGSTVQFVPATNFLGIATIGYTISDGIGGTNSSVITITVTNIPPVANPDSASTTENTSITVSPLVNDSVQTPGGSLTIIGVSPTNGTVSIISGTNVLFMPATNFVGTATIGYTIKDGIGGTNSSLITVTVTNIPPIANPDSASITENTSTTVSPLVNDTVQTPGGSLTIIGVSPTNGTASIVSGTNVLFTPATNFLGTATIGYTIKDGIGGTNSSLITVTVTNIAPVANPDNISGTENTVLTIKPTANDTVSTPGGNLTVIAVAPTNGTATIAGGTNVLFTPATNFLGTATIGYTITDGIGGTNGSLITITITNIAPVANPDTVFTPENVAITVKPLTNDVIRTPGGSLTIIGVSPTNGTASILGGTNVLFTPATNFVGTATIGYTIIDGIGGTNSSVITVTVVGTPPTANGQSVSTPQNVPLAITLTGSDPNSLPLTFVIVTGPANGALSGINTNTGAVTYTPNTDYKGPDSFTFRVDNGVTNSTPATVTISVLAAADLGVFKAGPTNVMAGSNVTYTITVTNIGPSTATNVVAVDQLPAGFAFVSASPAATVSNNLVSWSVATLARNVRTNFTVTVVSADGGTLTNIAYATTTTLDPNPTNSDGTATNSRVVTAVTPMADVAIFKTGNTNAAPGGTLTYTIIATNSGPSTASNVVVRDTLPATATFQSASSGYTLTSNIVSWTVAALAKSASSTFTVTITAPANGVILNTASSTADTFDNNTNNNNGTAAGSRVTTTVTPIADLQVSLTGPTNVSVGDGFVYTIVVSNAGPSTATSIATRDTLPTNLTFTAASGGGFLSNGIVVWPLLSLPAGGSTNLTVDVSSTTLSNLLASTANKFNFLQTNTTPKVATLTNIASAFSPVFDPNLTNNTSAQVRTFILPSSFSVVVSTNTYPAGTVLTNTIIPKGGNLFAVGTAAFNPQTGLFEETVTVTNIGTAPVHALRLYVGGLRTGIKLYNATGTNNGMPYVEYDPPYNSPLMPYPQYTNNVSVTFVLEFFVPDRKAFTNSLLAVAINSPLITQPVGTPVAVSRSFMDVRATDTRYLIEFNSTPGRTYTILYGPDVSSITNVAMPSIIASANVTQWYDDGPPVTISKPTSVGSRYYIVILQP